MLETPLGMRIRRQVMGLAVVCALVSIVLIAGVGLWMAFSDVPIIGASEPNVIYTIEKVLAGKPLYGNPDEAPFDVTQYSPLYYLLAGTVGRMLGIDASDPQIVWRLARLTAWTLSVVLLALHYALLTRVLKVHWAMSVVAVAYAYVATCPYLFYARPDTALTLTTIACLFFLLHGVETTDSRQAWSAAAATVAAFLSVMSKQSGIVIVGVLFLYYLATGQRRLLLVSAATFAACLAVLTLALGSVDAARLFAANVVGGLNNGLAFYHGIFVVIIPYIRAESVLVAAMGGILVGWLGGAPGRTRVIFAIALPALFGFAVLTGLKVGSGPNYFNEFTFAATAAVAYALQTRGTHSSPRQDWLIMAGALYATVLLPVRTIENVYQFSYGRSEPASLRPLRSTQLEAYDELTSFLAANTDPARGEYIVTFDRGLMTILPFHTITPQTELASDRYRQGLSDLREFTALVKAGRVKYVVFLRGQIWPDYLGLTLSEHFEHFRDYPGQVVFRYRERP